MRYRAYGLSIESDVELDLDAGDAGFDLRIRRAQGLRRPDGPPRWLAGDDGAVPWTLAVEGEVANLWFADAGTFRVDADERIVYVDPAGAAHRVERYLLATALSCAVSVMGRLPLHAGTVACPAGSLAVCGRSGFGKSTAVMSLAAAGWDVLHDDMTVLTPDHVAHVGPRRARVHPDAAEILRLEGQREGGNVVVHVGEAQARRLRALLLLEARGGEPGLRRLAADEAAVRMGQQAGWWVLLTPKGQRARFELLARLAESVPCYAWSPPVGVARSAARLTTLAEDLVAATDRPQAPRRTALPAADQPRGVDAE